MSILVYQEMDALEALFSESNAVSFDFILPQLILLHSFQMSALKSANKKLKKNDEDSEDSRHCCLYMIFYCIPSLSLCLLLEILNA